MINYADMTLLALQKILLRYTIRTREKHYFIHSTKCASIRVIKNEESLN